MVYVYIVKQQLLSIKENKNLFEVIKKLSYQSTLLMTLMHRKSNAVHI